MTHGNIKKSHYQVEMSIIQCIKLQEGKDQSKDSINKPWFDSQSEHWFQLSALIWKLIKPVNNTGKLVTTDSGFCVGAWIRILYDVDVFGQVWLKSMEGFIGSMC